jgi:hypothetical protein
MGAQVVCGAKMNRDKLIGNHWFVSVETPKQLRLLSFGAPRPARETKAFPTEIEAKQFAIAMLSEGRKVTAGTLSLISRYDGRLQPRKSIDGLGKRSNALGKTRARKTLRIVVQVSSNLELLAERAGLARPPRRTLTCNRRPIASKILKTVLKFGCLSPAKAR